MSGAISASTLAMVALGGVAVSQLMQPKMPDAPKIPKPEAPPQSAQAPDEAARRANRQAAQAATTGPNNTMLTGSQGIAASTLNLGKNTLLGS